MKEVRYPSPQKARGFPLAAIREVFEETGLVLGIPRAQAADAAASRLEHAAMDHVSIEHVSTGALPGSSLSSPSPMRGRVGVGGREVTAQQCPFRRPPPPTPPHMGEGRRRAWRHSNHVMGYRRPAKSGRVTPGPGSIPTLPPCISSPAPSRRRGGRGASIRDSSPSMPTRLLHASKAWSAPTPSLVELVWLPIEDAMKLDMPGITMAVLEELKLRTAAGFAHDLPVPFYRMQRGRRLREMLE